MSSAHVCQCFGEHTASVFTVEDEDITLLKNISTPTRQDIHDPEECRLLGYKNPVRTSQETHYVYATESSQLMLRKI
jgi:hypothetical protein